MLIYAATIKTKGVDHVKNNTCKQKCWYFFGIKYIQNNH